MITSATVVVADRVPETPVMVNTASVLGAAESLAVSVSVAEVAEGFEAQDAVTPLGRPEVTASSTLFSKPG